MQLFFFPIQDDFVGSLKLTMKFIINSIEEIKILWGEGFTPHFRKMLQRMVSGSGPLIPFQNFYKNQLSFSFFSYKINY